MTKKADYHPSELHVRIDDLVEQVRIGSGEDDLAAAIRAALGLCAAVERAGNRSVTTRQVRDAIRAGLA